MASLNDTVKANLLAAFSEIQFSNPDVLPNMINPSIWGAVAEHVTRSIIDSGSERDSIFNEISLMSATQAHTIYNHAAFANVPLTYANPSKCNVVVGVSIRSILLNGVRNSRTGTLTLTIPRQTVFRMGDYTFMLPNSVVIEATPTSSGSAISVARCSYGTDVNIPRYSKANEPIQNWIDDGLSFEVTVYQVKLPSVFRSTIYADSGSTWVAEIPYTGQIAGFSAKYKYLGETFEITEKIFGNTQTSATKWLRYIFINQILYIMFYPAPEWRPPAGSELIIEYFTTEGDLTFTYNGLVGVTIKDGTNNPILSNVEIWGRVSSVEVSGGSDFPTLDELRERIRQYNYNHDVTISNPDVAKVINNLTSGDRIQTKIISTRNDIKAREYVSLTLFKTTDGIVVPTNTVDIVTSYAELIGFGGGIPAVSPVIYDELDGYYRFAKSEELLTGGNYPLKYVVPLKMALSTSPYQNLIPIFEYNSETLVMTDRVIQKYFSTIPQNLKISQDGPFSNLMFNITLSIDADNHGPATDGSSKSDHLMVRVFFYDYSTNERIGMVDMARLSVSDKTFRYQASLDPTKAYSGQKMGYTANGIMDGYGNQAVDGLFLPEKLRIEVVVFYDTRCSTDEGGLLSDQVEFSDIVDLSTDTTEYVPIAVLKHSATTVSVFRTVEALAPEIDFRDTGAIILQDVPVIGMTAYGSTMKHREFNSQLLKFIGHIASVEDNLFEQVRIRINFANTYGFSTIWNECETTQIKVGLKISLISEINQDVKDAIIQKIIDFVDAANDSGYLSSSELAHEIKQLTTAIRFVEVKGLANQWRQSISRRILSDEEKESVYEVLNTNSDLIELEFS